MVHIGRQLCSCALRSPITTLQIQLLGSNGRGCDDGGTELKTLFHQVEITALNSRRNLSYLLNDCVNTGLREQHLGHEYPPWHYIWTYQIIVKHVLGLLYLIIAYEQLLRGTQWEFLGFNANDFQVTGNSVY